MFHHQLTMMMTMCMQMIRRSSKGVVGGDTRRNEPVFDTRAHSAVVVALLDIAVDGGVVLVVGIVVICTIIPALLAEKDEIAEVAHAVEWKLAF